MERSLAIYVTDIRKKFSKYGSSLLEKYNLTDGTYQYLIYINKQPGSTPGEMANWFEVDNGHITRCAAKLESLGYVKRQRKVTDKRQILLYPTTKGKKVYEKIASLVGDFDQYACRGLTGEEKELLLRLLETIKTGLKEV